MLLRLLRKLLKDEKEPSCLRCGGALVGEPEAGLYCEACNTTFETEPEFHYGDPTRGVQYHLTGKSYYGAPH